MNPAIEHKDAMHHIVDYRSNATVRQATPEEWILSVQQARRDGGAGVITVADYDRPVYVD